MNTDQLIALEKTGRYVFHGSPDGNISELVPMQGRHFPNPENQEEFILDGNPAISATPYVEIAIFRALFNKQNIPSIRRSGFGLKNGKPEFRLSDEKILEVVKGKEGFVYVFNKKDFEPYSRDGSTDEDNMEWRAYKELKPAQVIRVNYENIKPFEKLIEFTDSKEVKIK